MKAGCCKAYTIMTLLLSDTLAGRRAFIRRGQTFAPSNGSTRLVLENAPEPATFRLLPAVSGVVVRWRAA
jgi:hypothetical protein